MGTAVVGRGGEQEAPPPLLSLSDLYKTEQKVEPLLEGFIYRGDAIILAGQSEVGKSLLSLNLAFALASRNSTLFDLPIMEHCKVCYVPTEGSLGTVKNRCLKFGETYKVNESNLRVYNYLGRTLNRKEDYEAFRKTLETSYFIPDLIIIDTLYMAFDGDINSNKDATAFGRMYDRVINDYNCAIMLVHHYGKATTTMDGRIERGGKDVLGASAWANWATTMFRLRDTDGVKELSVTKDRDDKICFKKLNLELIQDPLQFSFLGVE